MHAHNMKDWCLRSNNADRCLQIKPPPVESPSLIVSRHPRNTNSDDGTSICLFSVRVSLSVGWSSWFYWFLLHSSPPPPPHASVLIIHHSKNEILPSTAWQRGSLFSVRVMRRYQYLPNKGMLNASINCDEWCWELNAQPPSFPTQQEAAEDISHPQKPTTRRWQRLPSSA